jgi:hypothetical protein
MPFLLRTPTVCCLTEHLIETCPALLICARESDNVGSHSRLGDCLPVVCQYHVHCQAVELPLTGSPYDMIRLGDRALCNQKALVHSTLGH